MSGKEARVTKLFSSSIASRACGCWTPAFLFTLVGGGQMLVWGQQKHRRYKKEFPGYPKNRRILFPFLY